MKKRILHLIDHLGYGGAPIVVKDIAESLHSEHIEIIVCALRTNPEAIKINTTQINLRYHKYNPLALLSIINIYKQYKIDIVHAHLTKSIMLVLIANFFSKVPIIIHEHGPVFRKGLFFSIYRFILKILRNRTMLIIANSQVTAQKLVDTIKIDKGKIQIIPNAVDFSKFDSEKINKNEIKTELGIKGNDIVIGFIGRLHHIKGVDILLLAFSLLMQESDNYLLIIAGDGPERNNLENQTEQLNVTQRVKFLGTCDNIAEVISVFDIGVVPSRHESFGIVALEMMRMKRPVVCSGVEGLSELITDGMTGLVTQENSPEAIAASIKRLNNDDKLYNYLVENAYDFTKKYEIGKYTEQLESVYKRIYG